MFSGKQDSLNITITKDYNSHLPCCFTVLICANIAVRMGTIMAAVAVLDIHIDRNHVGSIKPSINLNIANTILLEHKAYQGEQLLDKDIGQTQIYKNKEFNFTWEFRPFLSRD